MTSFSETYPAPHVIHTRKRGALLVEAALAVGIAISLIGLTISINAEQERRQDAISIGAEKKVILDAARNLILDQEADLLQQLFVSAVDSGSTAQLSFTPQDLVNIGYIPTSFQPGALLDRLFEQDYVILMRPVFRDDVSTPADILGRDDMDPFGTGSINPLFIDGDLSNRELGIEAVLFTRGGQAVPPGQGNRVLSAVERVNAGFITDATQSRGIGGTMNFNITGFSDFPEFADIGPGRFASPVSLGSIGAIGANTPSNIPELRETFLRCVGLVPGEQSFLDCIAAPRNEVFGDIILRGSDTDNDGTEDRFPMISGATRILCRDAVGDPSDPVAIDAFLIDCQRTEINGVLDITGQEVLFAGETLVETRDIAGSPETVLTADRLAMRIPGSNDRDMSTIPFASFQAPARSVFDVQDCPDTDINGQAVEPQANGTLVALLDPWGRAVSGNFVQVQRGDGTSNSWTPSSTGSRWMVRIFYSLNSDFCNSNFESPIDIRRTFQNPNDPTSLGNFITDTLRPAITECIAGNDFADIYEMFQVGAANFSAAQVTLSCRP